MPRPNKTDNQHIKNLEQQLKEATTLIKKYKKFNKDLVDAIEQVLRELPSKGIISQLTIREVLYRLYKAKGE